MLDSNAGVFLWILRTRFFTKHIRWLLLFICNKVAGFHASTLLRVELVHKRKFLRTVSFLYHLLMATSSIYFPKPYFCNWLYRNRTSYNFFIRTTKILMRLNALVFWRLSAQNVLILFLSSMKHCYLLMLLVYFNTNLEEYKVIYPNGTCDYIIKYDFDGVQIIHL